ncbi:MAG: AraC family transcriptional regulator [Deltaproteobacteria bacterium]|nr:AraC family transcriptional regulator [Deltaproteobacteria bacterium]
MKISVKRLPVLDVNLYKRTPTGCLYPIQPYPYKNFAFPSGPFINLVAFYHQTQIKSNGKDKIIYPAGSAALVCRLDEDRPESFLVGTPTVPTAPEYAIRASDYFVAFFWISIGFCLFPIPPSEIIDDYIPLKYIFPEKAERFTTQMIAAESFDHRVAIFERFLLKLAMGSREIPKLHNTLIRKICRASTISFDSENQKVCCDMFSDRHARRLVQKYTGISPRLLIRILRYQKTLASIDAFPNQSMACLAASQGYFDQPHFIREFKHFQGVTPKEFVHQCNKGEDFTANPKKS